MKHRGHTKDCLDAAEVYGPCICGTDEYNRKVDLMTSEIPDITPMDLMVRDFHEAFGHPAPKALTEGNFKLRALRAELIREEFQEFLDAASIEWDDLTQCWSPKWNGDVDLVEMADALTDILWVTIGAMIAFGMDPQALMAEVWRSNMSKLGADGKPIYRADGKIMKGPNYSPPNIARVLDFP